mmetsp:Transcript_27303/g.42672  ORF Transcript_27303/g.42672 Transcript_27303/m.42672 type:complete len:258 (-) Transcript_27303:567-1340(-)
MRMGMSWASVLRDDSGSDMDKVLWPDLLVQDHHPFCAPNRLVYLSRQGAAKPELLGCTGLAGHLVNRIAEGLWSVRFLSTQVDHFVRVGQNGEFDLVYLESSFYLMSEYLDKLLASLTPESSISQFLQGDGGQDSGQAPTSPQKAVGKGTGQAGGLENSRKPLWEERETVFPDYVPSHLGVWFWPDVADLVMEGDASCVRNARVTLSLASQPQNPDWAGLEGVLLKKISFGLWIVRFPRERLDRITSEKVFRTGYTA